MMKKLNVLLVITSLFLLFACDDTDTSDTDEIGNFSITVDGQTYEGETVFNGAVLGIRSISAETEGFELACLIAEDKFTKGNVLSIDSQDDGILLTLILGDEDDESTIYFISGTVTVVSTSKIEIDAMVMDYSNDTELEVTGYISSK